MTRVKFTLTDLAFVTAVVLLIVWTIRVGGR